MNTETQAALRTINRRFYERYAEDFSATRQHAWPGWNRVAGWIRQEPSKHLKVLDLGCGNGRLASHLLTTTQRPIRYLGVDSSQALLDSAATRLGDVLPEHRLKHFELTEPSLSALLGATDEFDLLSLMGVLHHLPGSCFRRALLRELARWISVGGLLVLTIWRLNLEKGLAGKMVAWEQIRERPRIDTGQLEDGDYLLTWRGSSETPRYCHFPTEEEIASWIDDVPLPLVDRFVSDGRSDRENLYLIFQRPETPSPWES